MREQDRGVGEDVESRLAKVEQDSSVDEQLQDQSNNASNFIENEQESPVVDEQSQNVKEAKREKLEELVVERVTSSEPDNEPKIPSSAKSQQETEIETFLIEEYKKGVSEEIRQRNREKKLQHETEKDQTQVLSSVPITRTGSQEAVRKIPYNQKVEEGIIQEVISFIQKVAPEPIDTSNTVVADGDGRNLAQLFSDAEVAEGITIEAKQKELIYWYLYRESYQNKVAEIQSKTGVAEKTAKSQVYTMIKASLSNVAESNLYKKTQRAGSVYKLFGKIIDPVTKKEVKGIGIDKAYGISYGVRSISELTDFHILISSGSSGKFT